MGNMSVQVENLEKNMAKLTVEVEAERLEKALDTAYNRQKKSISIPGFRKGKVPRVMVEKRTNFHLQDTSVKPCSGLKTVYVASLAWTVLPHSPYLMHSGFHLFRLMDCMDNIFLAMIPS